MPSAQPPCKILERDNKIAQFLEKFEKSLSEIPDSVRDRILGLKAWEVHEQVCKQAFSAKTATLVFCVASIEANKKTNCLTEVMFEEALHRAQFLDDFWQRNEKPIGPFHGIPFSIKDTFDVADFDSTIGLMKNCFKPKKTTASLVQFIIECGGIPFVKTNVPQTLMSFECSNPVWGKTVNSSDSQSSPGGSSGGEAALLAAKGSVIGLGSDIGGSLRIPAHFSGIFSFKPSYSRLSRLGSSSYKPVHIAVEPVMGPMATCAKDLQFFCKATFGHPACDVLPLTFRHDMVLPLKARFAYSISGFFIDASPVCNRAVLEAVDSLRNGGYEVVEFKFPKSFTRLVPLFYQLMSADGWKFYLQKLGNEEREPYLRGLLRYASLPNWIKHAASWIASLLLKDNLAVDIIKSISAKSTFATHLIQTEINEIAQEFLEEFKRSGAEILVTPVNVLPATPLQSFGHIHYCAAYTFVWNLLNLPIGVLPVAKFDKERDMTAEWPRKFTFQDIFSPSLLQRASQHYYNPNMSPLPVGVQVIGAPSDDEKVLDAMVKLEAHLKL